MCEGNNISKHVCIIGDAHGQLPKIQTLLRDAQLIDSTDRWVGKSASVWFLGDFCDRGPDGIGVIDLVMRLQHEASAVGGAVHALLGNHDVLILAVHRFSSRRGNEPGGVFIKDWQRNGGIQSDLDRLSTEHIHWLSHLPAMALVQERLLIHADSDFYMQFGQSIDTVNANMQFILHNSDASQWNYLLDLFAGRKVFDRRHADGAALATRLLRTFGGRQIIHGHTPINYMNGMAPEQITEAFVYQGGRCVNADGGMYLGGPGFVYRLGSLDPKLSLLRRQ
ncbi:MAG: hypothetical protein GFH27_549297n5 [Chloroflexi bacterium AL-W]|nr:hypothetical protein [Chloroflexi bacterium AL-N1]NOK68531.1 hypothetical protein [Chloroflexi bacterium AL-N10]NOK76017.1 hypothetical protein [Chloroflexi bacterium AL-N5]NOK82488.1 hypothetical protein [Chloroflexi bacterium AL-W]NOK92800.1 hypothetical protein [Chloroflexi bacterium AL-N15]